MSKITSRTPDTAARPRRRPVAVVLRVALLVAAAYGMAMPARSLPVDGLAVAATRDGSIETQAGSPVQPVGGLASWPLVQRNPSAAFTGAGVESPLLVLLGISLIGAGTLLSKLRIRTGTPESRRRAQGGPVPPLVVWKVKRRRRPPAQALENEEAAS
jgi:hypothetical protein